MSFSLREYQQAGLDEIRRHLRAGVRSVLWQMPTGAGKTASTAHMLKGAAAKGNRAWFVVHRRELIMQSHKAFKAIGVEHGIIAAGFDLAMRRPVQICSVGTLGRRLDRVAEPQLIVFDEAHHMAAGTWQAIFRRFPRAVHIGLSATPERLDGQGLEQFFMRMVPGPTVRELITGGYLVPYRLFAPAMGPDLSGVHKRAGDYARDELAAVMGKPKVVGDAVEHYRRVAMGRRAVVFAVSIEASQRIVQAFRDAGIPAEHVDGETAPDERDAAIKRFAAGTTRVLSNVELFGEGFDLPAIEAVILLRPTQSLAMYLQQVGRGLRTAPGKADCIILDHAGNSARHGLPDDDREWTLAGHDAKQRAASDPESSPIRQCPACFAISPAAMLRCRECGEPFPVQARNVEHVEGELQEVAIEEARRVAKREQAQAATLDTLIELGRMRGYRSPERWAQHVWNGRQQRRATA